jgi:glycosyltransferase involved in cell wall biosynthesis
VKQKILYLSRGGHANGSQKQLYYLVTSLDRKVFEPIVVCSSDGQFVKQLRNSGIETHVLGLHPWRKFPAALFRYFDAERLLTLARERQVALIHNSDLWLNNYLLWSAGRLKLPSVLHVRTPINPKDVIKHRCDGASLIVAISPRIKKDLMFTGISSEKIELVYDAVDINLFNPRNLRSNVLRRDFSGIGEVLVGIIGRIHPSKRQLDFVKATGEVIKNSKKNVTFFLIGEVHDNNYFREISRFVKENNLTQHVSFTLRRDDMPEVLSSLDILVSLSGGSVMYEAMACATPVISAGFTSQENSIHIRDKQTGILISSRQNSLLVEAILKLMDDTDLKAKIGCQARKWAEQELSHIKMVEKMQNIYSRLL